jgi:hypothetical protein
MASRQREASGAPAGAHEVRRWSRAVTERSNALDLEPGVFSRSPREIARSLKRSADRSTRRKSSPFRSAMSMLTFYENRGGRNLSAAKRRDLRRAKDELRRLYGRQAAGA